MRSVALLLAVPLALLIAPLAAAQVPVPVPPVPSDPVGAVCALVTGNVPVGVPVCPADAPAPQNPDPHAHDHGAAPPPPANPQDAPALANEVAGQAQQAADQPASAPSHVLGILAAVVQFVKDLLHLPVAGAQSVGLHSLDALGKVGHAAHRATDAVTSAAHGAIDHVKALFRHEPATSLASPVRGVAPTKALAKKADGLVADALRTVDGIAS